MRKFLVLFLSLCLFIQLKADEGMWLPMLLDAKYSEMVRKGLKMTPDMIYSVNHNSLKDAIVQFGRGCTGEMISKEGLLLTNHHCGYSSIAQVSSIDHNYLKDGFWSQNKSEEIPIPGLTAKFMVRMQDVTDQVMRALPRGNREAGDKEFDEAYAKVVKEIVASATKNTSYTAEVKPLYNGNQYFLWVYEIFSDVRFVAAPPENLGKFGGDTDNWMWPRHTADFSLFRVYADKNNEAADYSPSNVPYRPKHALKVSTAGVSEGDFAMIMGYPGRTSRYKTSYSVNTSIRSINPTIVKLRGKRLDIMKKQMKQDPAVKLQLASKYAGISNYWKYFIGQTEQLKRFDVIEKKKKEERQFEEWAGNKRRYRNLFENMLEEERKYRNVIEPYYYYNEGLFTPTLTLLGYTMGKLREQYSKDGVLDSVEFQNAMTQTCKDYYATFHETIDKETFAAMAHTFYSDVKPSFHPPSITEMVSNMDGTEPEDFEQYAEELYSKTIFKDSAVVLDELEAMNFETLFNDPIYSYAVGLRKVYEEKAKQPVLASRERQDALAKIYLEGLLDKNAEDEKSMYPDANSTMRLSYGTVEPYYPRDAVFYEYFTTLEGLIEKYKPDDYEFDAPLELIELYKEKDYGRYAADDGRLHLCFLTTNDITGGNSGSPVLNGSGDLIGLAFDGNWEAMCGDIYFDSEYKRTINVDTRYILWLIEKYGQAPNLISEMQVIENYE